MRHDVVKPAMRWRSGAPKKEPAMSREYFGTDGVRVVMLDKRRSRLIS